MKFYASSKDDLEKKNGIEINKDRKKEEAYIQTTHSFVLHLFLFRGRSGHDTTIGGDVIIVEGPQRACLDNGKPCVHPVHFVMHGESRILCRIN